MRTVILALVAAASLAACGQEPAKTNPPPAPAAAQFVDWASLNPDQAIVGEGVSYSLSNGAARIVGVPQNAGAGGSTGGVGVRLPDAFEAEASGKRVRVTVSASSSDAGALLGAAYSTADVGNSSWQAFPLTPERADYTFEYDVPTLQAGNGDFVGFRSYNDASVTVYGYKVEIVNATAPASN